MKETAKSKQFRERQGHFDLYLKGYGIDIGAGDDLLTIKEGTVDEWDLYHGDAQYMSGIEPSQYDFIYSSHCLEHMKDVGITLTNWLKILKTNGHLYFTVPDYVLYEKMRFPSIHNPDHKNTFSCHIYKNQVKRENHYHVSDIQNVLKDLNAEPVLWQLEDNDYDYNLGPDADQTRGNAQAQLLFVAKKL